MTDDYDLVTLSDPVSAVSEAYRTLRMNLLFAAMDQPLRSVLITSPGASEGKSTTLANLAVTMAQIEQRVIMVDCDLRRPCLHQFFDLFNNTGLTTMMLNDDLLTNPPLQHTTVDGLSLLASGPLPPRPSDLLGSKRIAQVIERLGEEADILLFDAPPVLAAADATLLATKVDGVLLVVSAGQTKREHARLAVERLGKVNARIVGSVLNNVALDASLGSYIR